MVSTCRFVCLLLSREHDTLKTKELTLIDSSTLWEQGHETINFKGQGVKGQGYTTPKLDHFRPLLSSGFSKYDLFRRCVTLTFDLLTPKVDRSCPCPADHFCQFVSKSV